MTIEMPYSFYNNNPGRPWVTVTSLRKNGELMLRAISDFFGWNIPGRYILKGTIRGKKTVYRYENLPAGEYQVFIWKDAWVPFDDVVQKRTGIFRCVIRTDREPYTGPLRVSQKATWQN